MLNHFGRAYEIECAWRFGFEIALYKLGTWQTGPSDLKTVFVSIDTNDIKACLMQFASEETIAAACIKHSLCTSLYTSALCQLDYNRIQIAR